LITETRLRDGTRALIMSLLPSDREALREGFEKLSPESRAHRFLAATPRLTEEMLDLLVDEVDGVNHIALALVVIDDENVGEPVAVGRMVRYPDRPCAVDVAVTVLDEWQGHGVASALLAELMRRRPEGVKKIVTVVAADNEPSLAMLRRLGGATVTPAGGGATLDVVVELPDPGESPLVADTAVPAS
jgi:RimJ/RimL family protein N-acetyltransferase